MLMRCPKCGRRGNLPDRWVPEAHTLRCRKCRAMFKTPDLAPMAAERGAGPAFDPVAGRARGEPAASYIAEGFFSGFDEPLVAPRKAGPGDSNYELAFIIADPEGDSGSDWDTETDEIAPEAPSSDEITALAPPVPAPEPWHRRVIESWSLGLIVAALVLAVVSIPTLAYLLWRTLGSAGSINLPTPALIAGLACSIAMLTISVPLLLLAAAVTELLRDVRRLSRHAEHRATLAER